MISPVDLPEISAEDQAKLDDLFEEFKNASPADLEALGEQFSTTAAPEGGQSSRIMTPTKVHIYNHKGLPAIYIVKPRGGGYIKPLGGGTVHVGQSLGKIWVDSTVDRVYVSATGSTLTCKFYHNLILKGTFNGNWTPGRDFRASGYIRFFEKGM